MTTAEILAAFPRMSALVVGDICLDRWCVYDPAQADPSRETGIPRIGVVSTEVTPGAGGTVANNLAALGCGRVSVLGIVGDDGFGYELRQALKARGIESDLLVNTAGRQTFTYTKLLNASTGEEDQPRVDFICTEPVPAETEKQLIENLKASWEAFDVILVSDQAETETGGVISPGMRSVINDLGAARPDKVIWVDSRLRAEHFRHVIVKPNQREAEEACLRAFGKVDFVRLRERLQSKLLLVTHGPDGVLLVRDSCEPVWVRTRPVENPVDICGAGDSFSAGAALALAVCGDPVRAAAFGNTVASITIMKKGTGTASPAEVLAATVDE
jgi:ADP-heptose synthase, bifunctional sugar kinase/adenylyltransferase